VNALDLAQTASSYIVGALCVWALQHYPDLQRYVKTPVWYVLAFGTLVFPGLPLIVLMAIWAWLACQSLLHNPDQRSTPISNQ
jgi:hypothetical protein